MSMGFFENFEDDKTYMGVFEQNLTFYLGDSEQVVETVGVLSLDQLKDTEAYELQAGTLGVKRSDVIVEKGDRFTDDLGRTWFIDNLFEQKGNRDFWKVHADNEAVYRG